MSKNSTSVIQNWFGLNTMRKGVCKIFKGKTNWFGGNKGKPVPPLRKPAPRHVWLKLKRTNAAARNTAVVNDNYKSD